MTLFEEMTALNDVKFDRCMTPPGANGDRSLVVFCDASRLAFGACAYARWKLVDGRLGTRFVAAKTRVAPLKELTILRLKLQAAVLGCRLGKSILEESRFNFERVCYFSDSRVALACIKGETRSFKPFVFCRAAEIQSNSSPENWSHCPTLLNVADDLTKGISTGEVHGRWFNRPEFLQLLEELCPMKHGVPNMAEVNKERRKVQITCVTAYVFRFCYNLRRKSRQETNAQEKRVGPLSAEEIQDLEKYWTKKTQSSLFKRMEKGDFKTLSFSTGKVSSESVGVSTQTCCPMKVITLLSCLMTIGFPLLSPAMHTE